VGEAIGRAQRDADELAERFCRLQNQGLLHSTFDAYRTAAENLVTEGWTRIRPGEKVVGPADAALLNEVQCAYIRWESLKRKLGGSAEVRRDESQRTSDVKTEEIEAKILAAFGSCEGPMNPPRFAVIEQATGIVSIDKLQEKEYEAWTLGFARLVEKGLIEAGPCEAGTVRRWSLTGAGVEALDTSIEMAKWKCWP